MVSPVQPSRFCRRHVAVLIAVLLVTGGCAQVDRITAVPAADARRATIQGLQNVRHYAGDSAGQVAEYQCAFEREANYFKSIRQPLPSANYLAISGGGDNGAFGAGLLVGWSERGTRPTFKGVTGISTGALIAPLAFLGPEYDGALTEVYTTIGQNDVFEQRPFITAISSDGMSDTTPLKNLIAKYLDDAMVAGIAREYGRGRLLFIATTDLDAGRAVIWNIGPDTAQPQRGNTHARHPIRRLSDQLRG